MATSSRLFDILPACLMSILFTKPLSAVEFHEEASFPSQHAYLRSLQKPFTESDSGYFSYFDKNGKLLGKIPLKDPLGYERHPHPGTDGAVVIKSTSGYEWARSSIEYFTRTGSKTAELAATSGSYALSPGGALVVMAHIRSMAGLAPNSPRTKSADYQSAHSMFFLTMNDSAPFCIKSHIPEAARC